MELERFWSACLVMGSRLIAWEGEGKEMDGWMDGRERKRQINDY